MADTVAQIDVQVTLDTKDFDKGIDNTHKKAEAAGSSIGGKISGGLKTMAKIGVASFAALATGAVAFGKQSFDAFTEANESFTKFTQIASNNKWSKDQQAALQDLNAELQRTGVVEGDALTAGQAQLGTFMLTADTVKTLTPALADMVAQQKGAAATADDVAQMSNLVGKVMTGNVGALSRYGVTLTDTQKKTLELGTESERAAILAEVLNQNFGGVNQALGATSQGALVQAKNAFGDVQEAIGGILTGEASFEDLDNAITSFSDSLGPLVDELLPSLVGVVGNLLQTLASKLPAILMQLLPPVLASLTTLINTLGPMLPGIINTLLPPLIQGFLIILQAIVQATPQIVQGLINMLPAIIDGLVQLTIAVAQALPQIITALVDALPTVLPQIIGALTSPEFISAMIGAGVTLFIALVQAIPKILGALVSAFGKLFSNLWDAIKKLATNIGTSIGNVVGGVFKSIVNGVISFFEGFINTPIKAINGVIGVVDAIVPGNQSGWKLKEVKFGRLAKGGFAANGASANIIGEAGNEVALPLERNTAGWAKPLADILSAEMVAFGGGGDTIVNMNVTATTQADWNDIAGQAARQLRLMKAGGIMVGITKLKLKRVSDGEAIIFGEYPFLFSQSMSFFNASPMRETVLDYSGYDGGEIVAQFKASRPLDVMGIIEAKQRDQYWAARTALSQFFKTNEDGTPTIYKAVFIKADGTMFAAQKCWLSANDFTATSLYEHRDAKFSFSLKFGDPYFYEYSEDEAGDEIMSNMIMLPLLTANAGGSVHDSVGATYDSVGKVYEAGSGGVQTININSVRNVYPIWTVYGSSVNPSLVSNTTGGTLNYTGTINSGDILVIDMAAQTAKLNGSTVTANVTGDWIYLIPGQNTIGYNSSSASGLGEMSDLNWNGVVG